MIRSPDQSDGRVPLLFSDSGSQCTVMKRFKVALGVVVEQGRVLLCQRVAGDRFEGCWEFPGGKVEPAETETQALHRELAEELGIRVRVVEPLPAISHDYGDLSVTLFPFIVEPTEGVPEPRSARECRWVFPDELAAYSFPAANAPLVAQLPAILEHLSRQEGR